MKIQLSDVRKFGNIEMLARQLVEGFITGLHKSPYHGFSVEFAEHRLYNPGESTRHIDWKVFSRTDKLFTKRYEEETNLRCQLIVDTSSSMYYPGHDQGKITFSIMASACIAYLLQGQRDAVGLTTFSEEIEFQSQVRSTRGHIHSLLVQLETLLQQVPHEKKTQVASTLHQMAENIPRRSLVVLFSDMLESTADNQDVFSALQHLKHNKHEVLLFHVFDGATEADFAFDDRPHEFIDIETGERLKVQPSQVKEWYQIQFRKHMQEMKLKCDQYKIDFIPADIRQGFDQILSAYLIKRTKMR
ncbi:MAG: DUF58 domain-containing protein [Cytophagaceae bacterium]|jgi:uncharacterized protein (DUF58 family)|nr:DUF58 domain-containing protein [Cytophagaceae bacterium]